MSWRERQRGSGQFECFHGDRIEIDPSAGPLVHGLRLVLDDGRNVDVIAMEEKLLEIMGDDLAALARQLLSAGIAYSAEPRRLLVLREKGTAEFLRRYGATVREVSEPFEPDAPVAARAGGGPKAANPRTGGGRGRRRA